ncbi:MAG: serine hydrolase domain-containing protein [Turneriella sp.]
MRCLNFLIISLLVCTLRLSAESENIRAIMAAKMQRYGTPGMVATIIRNGKISETIALGFADRENKRPMSADTQLPAASLTKLMTAALVMRQVEAGRLELDKPVNSYLVPSFYVKSSQGTALPATLRQLLSHSSGLPTSWKGIASKGDTPQSLEKFLSRGQKAVVAPGERIIYANDAFSLAGYVAAAAEKEDFAAHATRVFLRPLQMNASSFESPWTLKSTALSKAYGGLMGGSALGMHNDLTAALPAGGLITTAPDFARFALMLLDEGRLTAANLLRPQSIRELFTIQAKPHPRSPMGFGLGFAVKEEPGRSFAWWDGGLAGAAHRMILHVPTKTGVVLLSNLSENAASSEAANAIFDLLVPPAAHSTYKPAASELEKHVGNYRFYNSVDPSLWFLRYGIDLNLTVDGDTLRYKSRLLKEGRLRPLAPGIFRLEESMLAGADVFFDGDTVFIGHLSAQRIPFYASAGAILLYASLMALALLYLLYRVVRSVLRKMRHSAK